jgi:chemotaxis protein MotB
MALSQRGGNRFQANTWPGFVDAMTGLLLVLMFVLTIFMVIQFVRRETITGQESKLSQLTAEISALTEALGLERDRSSALAGQVGSLTSTLSDLNDQSSAQAALIAALTAERDAQAIALAEAENRITGFEAQVAGLLALCLKGKCHGGQLGIGVGEFLAQRLGRGGIGKCCGFKL